MCLLNGQGIANCLEVIRTYVARFANGYCSRGVCGVRI